jgi:hypothetical protein
MGLLLLAALVVGAGSGSALARIKLATLPPRERVEVQLDNENATLVEEERVVTLLEGTNWIDFSWSNTQIDRATILFRPIGTGDSVRVIHVAYPPGENALTWQVWADKPIAAKVRVSYLIGNLRRSFSYRAIAEADEKSLTLRHYMRVWNFSGEEFGDQAGLWAGFGEYFRKELGLQESKEVLLGKFAPVPIKKKFIFNWRSGQPVPEEPFQKYVRWYYLMKNEKAAGLGGYPMPFGKVRIFLKDAKGGEAFMGEDWGQFTPIDDEMKLYLGLARDVKVERTVKKNNRTQVHGNLHHQEVIVQYKMQNFKKEPLVLDIEEDMNALRDEFAGRKDHPAQWELGRETTDKSEVERKSAQNVEIHIPLQAAPKAADQKPPEVIFLLHLFFRNEW